MRPRRKVTNSDKETPFKENQPAGGYVPPDVPALPEARSRERAYENPATTLTLTWGYS